MAINWKRLDELRTKYVSSADHIADYWGDDSLLQDYHDTLAQRIKWKWQSVLSLVKRQQPQLFDGKLSVMDWGCGTGVAGESFCSIMGEDVIKSLFLSDRSSLAVNFSRRRLSNLFPRINLSERGAQVDVALVSHVLTEMNDFQLKGLVKTISEAQTIIWVDAGTKAASSKLIQVREMLRGSYRVVAPCFHQKECGMLDDDNRENWCHFFADVPKEAHQTSFWREFSEKLKIDLRSLPVSFLVLTKKNIEVEEEKSRVIGRVREYKGYCKALLCNSNGVNEKDIQKKWSKKVFKRLCKFPFCDEYEISK